MHKNFKYRIIPTKQQRTKLNSTLEICRKVYNNTLALRKTAYELDRKSLSLYDTNLILTKWKKEEPILKQVYSQVLQNVQERVDLAFQAFFRRCKKEEKPGYPRFKAFRRYDSFTFPQSGFKLNSDGLYISKIGIVKIKLHRPLEGRIKNLTIQRDSLGNWYACFTCITENHLLPLSNEMIGIDLGLTTFATFSTGETIKRQRWMKQDEKDLKRTQRKMEKSDKVKKAKIIRILNHIHTRIKNRRNNFTHQESRKLVNRFGLIVFENLDIQDMFSNGSTVINKGIQDVSWGQFIKSTVYKAEEAGRGCIQIDPKGTTQECSSCHSVVPKDLSVRIHSCPICGLVLNRDHNAAINILSRGLTTLRLRPIEAPDLSGE